MAGKGKEMLARWVAGIRGSAYVVGGWHAACRGRRSVASRVRCSVVEVFLAVVLRDDVVAVVGTIGYAKHRRVDPIQCSAGAGGVGDRGNLCRIRATAIEI